jgi:hypothetical protein
MSNQIDARTLLIVHSFHDHDGISLVMCAPTIQSDARKLTIGNFFHHNYASSLGIGTSFHHSDARKLIIGDIVHLTYVFKLSKYSAMTFTPWFISPCWPPSGPWATMIADLLLESLGDTFSLAFL